MYLFFIVDLQRKGGKKRGAEGRSAAGTLGGQGICSSPIDLFHVKMGCKWMTEEKRFITEGDKNHFLPFCRLLWVHLQRLVIDISRELATPEKNTALHYHFRVSPDASLTSDLV